ncbi:Dihydroneopterin aldolase [hydrothermal vent metagenome]|uniref:Dihydroneopterin aldolase n=1 Tax=hydrothermal vent metagenome TaxID=652676 RepID=A0A1W1EE86_9ZZZZ
MNIHIENLTLNVIIGLLDFERDRPQRVIVDVEISYEYSDEKFINYADVAHEIELELKDSKYELLEDALLGVKNRLNQLYPNIETLKLKISKPDILNNCSVSLSENWEF